MSLLQLRMTIMSSLIVITIKAINNAQDRKKKLRQISMIIPRLEDVASKI